MSDDERNTLIRIMGLVNGGKTAYDGQYVVEYDASRPGREQGTGRPMMMCHLVATPDRAKATRYTAGEAHELWTSIDKRHPVRPDGKPNRPFTAFTSVVYWTGVDCITVRSLQSSNKNYTGFDTICGGNSTVTYGAVSGEYIGADPMPFDQTRTGGCSVYIDGAFSYGDYAPDGDYHDVNCLRTLSYDYYPNGVQGRAA
jgi:hypothetical protein